MIQQSTTWYSNLLHDTTIYYMIQQSTTWYNNLLHDTAIYYMIQQSTTWYSNLLHDTAIFYMIQQSTTWYSNLLHDTAIYYMKVNLIWVFDVSSLSTWHWVESAKQWLDRNHGWLGITIMCPRGATCLFGLGFFSLSVNLAYWSSTKRASPLFQWI
jgi:uncharacterized RmlC-like cupin family protein